MNWTTNEINILKNKYPDYGCRIPPLSHHSPLAIIAQAGKHGINYVPRKKHIPERNGLEWESWEYKALEEEYPYYGTKSPSLLGRSRLAILKKARQNKIRYKGRI